MKKIYSFLLSVFLLLIGSLNVWGTTVTYTITSTTAVSTYGTAPEGSSASFSQNYSTKCQMTSGKSMTLTLSGYAGYTITGLTLSMKSNKSSGSGSLAGSAGSTFAKIDDAAFNTSSWHGDWSTSYVDVTPTVTPTAVTGSNKVMITISASANSLYCESFTLTYEETSSAEATTTLIDDSGITNTNKHISASAGTLSATVYDSSDKEIGDATVTWSSSNEDVATINATTGAVNLVAAGTTIITASYAGITDTYKSSEDTYELVVTNEDPTLVTIWSEDFSSTGYSTRSYTYSYTTTNSSSVQSSDNYAGGTAPEMMVKATGGTFSATIPLNNYAGDLKMKYKTNANTLTISSGTTGVSMSGTSSFSTKETHEVTFTGVTADMTSINIIFTASSSNVRLDDIVLKGKQAPDAPTFDVDACIFDEAFDLHLSTLTDGATIYYTTDGTTPTSSSSAYSDKITIPASTTTVKAIAIKDGLASKVASVTYTYDTRTTPSFSLSDDALEIEIFDDSHAITLTTNSDGAVTFVSSDGDGLDVDNTENSKVGVLSPLEAGEYTVTVQVAATATYLAAEGTVTITVYKKATTISITDEFDSKDIYVSTDNGGTLEAIVKHGESALSPQPTVTWTSSNTSVATIDEDGLVEYVAAGTTTITASYAGSDEYAASEANYVLTLTDSSPQKTEVSVSLNNSFFGCTSFTSWTTGMATTLSGSEDKVSIIYGKGTSSNMYCSTEKVRFYTNNAFSINAPSGYFITKVVFDATISSATPSGTISEETWTGNASSVSFTFANKTDISSVTITLAETVTIGASGYATYVAKHDISFPDGVTGYIVTAHNSSRNTITITEKSSVPTGTPIILKASAETYALPAIDTTPESVAGNLLSATVDGSGKTLSNLANVKYYRLTWDGSNPETVGFSYGAADGAAFILGANQAFLPLSIPVGAPSLLRIIEEENNATSIEELESSENVIKFFENGQLFIKKNGVIYDALGRVIR